MAKETKCSHLQHQSTGLKWKLWGNKTSDMEGRKYTVACTFSKVTRHKIFAYFILFNGPGQCSQIEPRLQVWASLAYRHGCFAQTRIERSTCMLGFIWVYWLILWFFHQNWNIICINFFKINFSCALRVVSFNVLLFLQRDFVLISQGTFSPYKHC